MNLDSLVRFFLHSLPKNCRPPALLGLIILFALVPSVVAKVTQPKVTQPKVTQPKVTQPKVTQPKVTQPKVTQPKVTQLSALPPTSTTAKKLIWSKSDKSTPLESKSCIESSRSDDKLILRVTFPKGSSGTATFIFSEPVKQSDGSVTGRVIFNDDPGNFRRSADNHEVSIDLDNSESARIIFQR